jgi:MFS family permease
MKEMGRIYWCHSLGNTAMGLVSVFIPIFLLKNGYSFQSVLVYLLLQQLFATIIQVPAGYLFKYISPHRLLVIGHLFAVGLFIMLATLNSQHWPLAWLALWWAGNRTIYWVAFHYVFSMARAHKRANHQIAGIIALNMLAVTAAPAIGGLIATHAGINYTYALAIIMFIAAVIPMLAKSGGPPKLTMRMPWYEIRKMRRDAVASGFAGIVVVTELNIWPMFIYLIVTSYAGIGLLTSAVAVASIAVTLYVGRHEKKKDGRLYFRRGLAVYGLANVVRTLAQTTLHVFGLNILGGVGRSLYVTPYMNRYYTNSDGEHRLGYITVMEAMCSLFAVGFILALMLLSLLVSVKAVLVIGLIFTALSSLGVKLIR